ncbi:MAG: sugar transferase [Ignavibacteriaceae bacterium]|nr:sugar transferase [Ignavibacteriaceae bacterium]
MKAMILAAGMGSRLMPLTLTIPKPMLPIANKPSLEHIIDLCKRHNITKIKMNLFHLPEAVDHYFRGGEDFGVEISYSIEKRLWGTAGGIKRVQSFFDETFVVLMGDGLTNIDLTAMLKFHREKGAKATIAVKPVEDPSRYGVVVTDENNAIKSFQEKPKKEEAKSNLINLGIYILEPEILDLVPPKEEYDFGHQLFPKLLELNTPFYAFHTDAAWDDIGGLMDYWRVNLDVIEGKVPGYEFKGEELKKGVFVHPSTKIDKKTLEKITAPVLIGRDVEINSGVEITGPAVIGDEVCLESGVSVIKSVVLNNTWVGKGIEIKDSVVNKNYHLSVPNNFGTYIDDDKVLKVHRIVPFRVKLDQFLINITDRIVGFFALLFLSPLFLVTAILIKLDSPGPVFYISKRLRSPAIEKRGKHWYVYYKEKSVKYYVFRTMYTDADRRVKELKNKYQSGPFIKIENDPRVTRVGRILRKTSIDELPLFWNVLKGSMSLVGIWALPVYEAQHLLEKGLKAGEGEESIDLTDVSQLRFEGKLGIAGFWQARGRSNLTAEERAIHDSFQSVLDENVVAGNNYLGEYSEFPTYKGYIKMLIETFNAVVRRTGAE